MGKIRTLGLGSDLPNINITVHIKGHQYRGGQTSKSIPFSQPHVYDVVGVDGLIDTVTDKVEDVRRSAKANKDSAEKNGKTVAALRSSLGDISGKLDEIPEEIIKHFVDPRMTELETKIEAQNKVIEAQDASIEEMRGQIAELREKLENTLTE